MHHARIMVIFPIPQPVSQHFIGLEPHTFKHATGNAVPAIYDYIQLVQAKGMPQRIVIMHHALRNTMIPIVTIMGPLLVNLLTGSMVVEKVFGIPGIGMLMVNAIQNNDYNVVIACAFVYSAMYIAVMLVVDILYGVIDPRIRVAKEGA